MMKQLTTSCDVVAERVACGEPVAELADHVASCAACTQLVALPSLLAATHRAADPGVGFAARVTGGAQQRLIVRRRRRVAGALAATVATAAIAVFALTRAGAPATDAVAIAPAPVAIAPAIGPAHAPIALDAPPKRALDPDVRTLVQLARAEHRARASAHWGRIERPLAAYHSLTTHGGTP